MSDYVDYIKTELGFWIVSANDTGILSVKFEKTKTKFEIKRNIYTDSALRQLRAYFDGHHIKFDLPLDMSGFTDFQKSVWNELLNIPYGETISYATLAQKLGNPKAIRAAASANGKNPFPIVVPCHRVIGSDGSLTGYALGLDLKEKLLQIENIISVKQMSLF